MIIDIDVADERWAPYQRSADRAARAALAHVGFEEDAVELTNVVPYLVEDMLRDAGADFQRGEDWNSFVVRDGNLITGQNPASSEGVAAELLNLLK